MEISPNFIDALSQSMGFNEADEEYRKGLHAFFFFFFFFFF